MLRMNDGNNIGLKRDNTKCNDNNGTPTNDHTNGINRDDSEDANGVYIDGESNDHDNAGNR